MSNKHKDALQAYALEEKQHGSGYMTYYDKSMEPDAEGMWLKRSDVEKLFRATEGQAQTSAAPWASGVPEVPVGDYEQFIVACKRANGKTYVFAAYYLNGKRLLSRWDDDTDESEDGTPVTGWFFENEVDGDNVFEPVCPEGDEVTHWQVMPSAPDAQLADSTAPGAPDSHEKKVNIASLLTAQKTDVKNRDGDWWRGYEAALHWIGKAISNNEIEGK